MNVHRRQSLASWGAKVRRMLAPESPARRYVAALLLGGVASFAMAVGCGDRERRVPDTGTFGGAGGPGVPDRCLTPNEGCECETEGDVVDCGRVTETFDDYITCQMGTRTCTDGAWSACTGNRVTIKSTEQAAGLRPLGLGMPTVCPKDAGVEFDPCDPYCNVTPDTAVGFDAGPGFTNDGGVTLVGSLDAGMSLTPCTTLTVTTTDGTAAGNTTSGTPDYVTVTNFASPAATTPPGPIQLTATPTGVGGIPCSYTSPVTTLWTVDQPDRAQAAGSTLTNGTLTVTPVAGNLVVTAYALGLSGSKTIKVAVNVVEVPTTNSPNYAAVTAKVNAFGACSPMTAACWQSPAGGSTGTTAVFLYPYADTYFPLGMLPPDIQYRYTTAASTDPAVKVSLRWPAGTSATASTFNYSIIVAETNNVQRNFAGMPAAPDPQVRLPDLAWSYFERTARNDNGSIAVQRNRGSASGAGTLENEVLLPIHFVNGQLKGRVYYNSYNSVVGGSTPTSVFGAVLKIDPNQSAPTRALPYDSTGNAGLRTDGVCTVCHTVSSQGNVLIAASGYTNGPGCKNSVINGTNYRGNSCSFSMPTNTWLATYPNPGASSGWKFNYGAPYPDGSFYLTNAYDNDESWDAAAALYRVSDGASLTSTGVPTTAVTPAFSHDGRAVAYNLGSGTSGTAAGAQLRVKDFSCGAAAGSTTCVGTSKTFSNERTVADCGSTGCVVAGHPSFLPDNTGIIYQHVKRVPGVLGNFSELNTWYGALAELWITSKNSGFTPKRLNALNGLTAAGANYLPTIPRSVSTPTGYVNTWHAASGGATSWVGDACSPGPTTTTVNEPELNYFGNASPQEAGDKYWVLFTSRRMYGNIAIASAWQAERSDDQNNYYGPYCAYPKGSNCRNAGNNCSGASAFGPASGFIETKKLWVSAIDKNWSATGDPSHPPFYLRGQELEAGNSNGYWVSSPCVAVDQPCVTDDDCCGGIGASPTTECRITSPTTKQCKNISSCSSAGGSCAAASCCPGLICQAAGNICIPTPPPVAMVTTYSTATFTRDYVASCPTGTQPAWRHFEWQATAPTGTSIEFRVQTSPNGMATTWAPTTALLVGTATTATMPVSASGTGTWYRGGQTVDQVLAGAMPPLPSRNYLRVSIKLNPSATAPPTLHQWRQIYDCVPAE